MQEISKKYHIIANNASWEFSQISDYIWKSPRLLDQETKLENQKIAEYFPDDPKLAELRWQRESHKIDKVFPYLIALGNMFSVMSTFESYLLIISNELEKDTGVKVSSVSGSGINRIFSYFRSIDIDIERIDLFHQIDAAIKVRNCLSHASGILSWSRDETELRRIQRSGTYLSREDRLRRKKMNGIYSELVIVSSAFGDRIQIENKYALVLTSYLRRYLAGLCQSSILLSSNTDNTEICDTAGGGRHQ